MTAETEDYFLSTASQEVLDLPSWDGIAIHDQSWFLEITVVLRVVFF